MTLTHKATVLVVEDDTNTRDMIVLLLAGKGYRVLSAENAIAALTLLESTKPDLIVLALWIVVILIEYQVNLRSGQQGMFSGISLPQLVVYLLGLAALFWFGKAQCCIFIFWTLLTVVGILFDAALRASWRLKYRWSS